MITLYTPSTGFPDLEVKIAYGLARIGIEAFGMEHVTIQKEGGFYKVIIDANEKEFTKFNQTLNFLTHRLLSSNYIFFTTPGITSKSAKGISVNENETFSANRYLTLKDSLKNKPSENICGHKGESVGNIIGLTSETSYHRKRDGIDISIQQNLPRRPTNPKKLCKVCALISILGIWYTTFIFNMGNREVTVIPLPKENQVRGQRLQEIFSVQHIIRKEWVKAEIPQTVVGLLLLSKIPSSSYVFKGFDLFIAILSRQQGYHVDGIFMIPIENYLHFINYSPYNIATIDKIYSTFINSNYQDAYDTFLTLNNVLLYKDIALLYKFSRLYTIETSPKDTGFTNLLFPETANYLLKEVAMIPQDIIENSSLRSLARTLRYFIRERKYSYADDIRNATEESRVFEETIAKMLREARLRYEQNKKIHLPNENEITEVFKLANQDFESTKTALIILAFSFPQKSEEDLEKEDLGIEEVK